ncbi:MAG: hypothetical protein HY549_10260 [Elusimicrobia bacterium]|nr:hypothetical protein [Elusimicrobiota bacterium]
MLEDEPTGRLAARIPFEGPIGGPGVGVWESIVSVLRNAFTRALVPALEGSIKLEPEPKRR